MSNIIDESSKNKHKIQKYSFESIEASEIENIESDIFKDFGQSINDLESRSNPTKKQESADELLKKIENLTDENIKLQLKLESIEKESDEKLKQEIDLAYQKGKEDGIKETTTTMQEDQDELKTQMVKSISILDEKLFDLKKYLDEIKDELTEAAIIIAKKVIKKEIDENSAKIALNLANRFLSDLKEATHIRIKTNPQDETFLKEALLDQKNIQIEPDDAINKGGIIILSDIGNIDGDIKTRIEKAISLIKQED